jgi:thioesterase domain-containing protein
LDRYVPKHFSGRLEVFRASTRPRWRERLLRNNHVRWLKLARQGGTVHSVPGNHVEMFRDGNIEVLAEKLRACLERAWQS